MKLSTVFKNCLCVLIVNTDEFLDFQQMVRKIKIYAYVNLNFNECMPLSVQIRIILSQSFTRG